MYLDSSLVLFSSAHLSSQQCHLWPQHHAAPPSQGDAAQVPPSLILSGSFHVPPAPGYIKHAIEPPAIYILPLNVSLYS